MVSFLVLILAILTLYLLSRLFIGKLFAVLYRLTRDRNDAATILGIIFLPGTFIHEISHFLAAILTFVPARDLELMPEATDTGVRLGRVSIAKTDFIRGSLIGLAPVIAGGAILYFALTYSLAHLSVWWVVVLSIYAVFEITHTMFSSSRDLFAVLELTVFLGVVSGVLLYLKIYAPFTFIYQEIIFAGPFVQKLSYFLFIPIALELVFLTVQSTFRR